MYDDAFEPGWGLLEFALEGNLVEFDAGDEGTFVVPEGGALEGLFVVEALPVVEELPLRFVLEEVFFRFDAGALFEADVVLAALLPVERPDAPCPEAMDAPERKIQR
ncbi:MAG TPA: hypothetical protein VGO69_11530 [Pyrinomonadaceae bacterium]|jgi:hypothetical protein|nr:hypothetical protein [Pyrinomonadaceae bacterium]